MCAGRRRANHNPSRASVNTRPSASAWRRRLQRRAGKKQLTGGLRGRGGGAVLCSFGDDAALARCCKRSFADLLLTLGCFLEGSCGLLRKGRGEGQIRSNLGGDSEGISERILSQIWLKCERENWNFPLIGFYVQLSFSPQSSGSTPLLLLKTRVNNCS